jgi:flagellar biosynthesis anti-sigma factor FlgM
MSIDRITSNAAASTYQVQSAAASAASAGQPSGKVRHGHHAHKAASTDTVTLSDSAKSLASARAEVDKAPDVREQKVADIKQQVSDGTYKVSAKVLARKMLDASNTQA